jgi:hypothetical protein
MQWSTADLLDDPAAATAAYEAEALTLRRQVERVQSWMANAESAPEWFAVSFATQSWIHLSPEELRELSEQLLDLLAAWSEREVPDDGHEREPVLVFARGFPAQP